MNRHSPRSPHPSDTEDGAAVRAAANLGSLMLAVIRGSPVSHCFIPRRQLPQPDRFPRNASVDGNQLAQWVAPAIKCASGSYACSCDQKHSARCERLGGASLCCRHDRGRSTIDCEHFDRRWPSRTRRSGSPFRSAYRSTQLTEFKLDGSPLQQRIQMHREVVNGASTRRRQVLGPRPRHPIKHRRDVADSDRRLASDLDDRVAC